MIEVIPGILEKNLPNILDKIHAVAGLVEWIQIDVMDHTLTEFDTYNNFADFKNIISQLNLNLEAHLMVLNPASYVEQLVNCGFKRIVSQVETPSVREFLQATKTFPIEAGLSIDTTSGLDMLEPYMEEISCVQVMTAKMGASGQEFDINQLFKVKQIRELNPELPIAVDGGLNRENAVISVENGATRLVSTSFIFKDMENVAEKINELKNIG